MLLRLALQQKPPDSTRGGWPGGALLGRGAGAYFADLAWSGNCAAFLPLSPPAPCPWLTELCFGGDSASAAAWMPRLDLSSAMVRANVSLPAALGCAPPASTAARHRTVVPASAAVAPPWKLAKRGWSGPAGAVGEWSCAAAFLAFAVKRRCQAAPYAGLPNPSRPWFAATPCPLAGLPICCNGCRPEALRRSVWRPICRPPWICVFNRLAGKREAVLAAFAPLAWPLNPLLIKAWG